jgi:hypothetical protein
LTLTSFLCYNVQTIREHVMNDNIRHAFELWLAADEPAINSGYFFQICDSARVEPGDLEDAIWDAENQDDDLSLDY